MTKAEQLLKLIEVYSHGNKSLFARTIGIKPQTLQSWLVRESYDVDVLYAGLENLNLYWLLSGGEGEVTIGDNNSHTNINITRTHTRVGDNNSGVVGDGNTVDSKELSSLLASLARKDEQIDRLIEQNSQMLNALLNRQNND